MEIDLVIENSFLDVRHPPKKSTSLKLDDLIKINKKNDNFLWLDIKNLMIILNVLNYIILYKKFIFKIKK